MPGSVLVVMCLRHALREEDWQLRSIPGSVGRDLRGHEIITTSAACHNVLANCSSFSLAPTLHPLYSRQDGRRYRFTTYLLELPELPIKGCVQTVFNELAALLNSQPN